MHGGVFVCRWNAWLASRGGRFVEKREKQMRVWNLTNRDGEPRKRNATRRVSSHGIYKRGNNEHRETYVARRCAFSLTREHAHSDTKELKERNVLPYGWNDTERRHDCRIICCE